MPHTGYDAYICAISYELGEAVAVDGLADEGVARRLPLLHAQGIRHCRIADEPPPLLAAAAAAGTLSFTATAPGAVVYCTETPHGITASEDLWTFAAAAGLAGPAAQTVAAGGCGNLGPGLRTARALLLAERLDSVLLVTADRFTTGLTRFVDYGTTVLSDGAATCLVTSEPVGPAFRIAGAAALGRTDASRETTRRALSTVPAVKTVVSALLEQLPVAAHDFRHLVTGHFGEPSRDFLTAAAGCLPGAAYAPLADEVGHCFSADPLISLAALARRGLLAPGDLVMLLASSPRSWTAIALEYTLPQGAGA
ncbi:hypothetical protein [Streptomyces sp. FH025]|uniref:hypothetical protein n=1 Tax=Streptomyces sp. FH025 TaxID=2815937 RepID=UPI001A9F29FB|nr:hypothetical protein [Streptomyces sp. FH025]MBO1419216.1 hypothetical protein [Streptomyces sp. FH025]